MQASSAADLTRVVERLPGRRVLLVGDFMLDRYTFGDADRISPEAPVPVLRVVERQERVGGAGSVALNIAALGGSVHCFGLLGRDETGARVLALLNDAGCDTSGLRRVADRPTITKERLVGLAEHRHRQQIIRVDDEVVQPASADDRAAMLAQITRCMPQVDAVCLEDYAKGLLAADMCQEIIRLARQHSKPVFVDPARKDGWEKYRGATLLTPNRAELEVGFRRTLADDELNSAALELLRQLDVANLVVTLGRDGARLVRHDGQVQHFPTTPRAVYDNTGAGDAVLAMLAMACAAGAALPEAVQLANVAGGLEVSKFGCVPISREEILDDLNGRRARGRGKIRGVAELLAELNARRQRGETVVFTNGCFDILHPGHVDLLERAKEQGALLVIGLNSDRSVRALGKGADRPIRTQADRARMLAALEAVDYVVIFDEPDPASLIEHLKPDVLVKGADWAGKGVIGQKTVEARGGRVVLLELVEGFSTTRELERIRGGG